MQRAQYFDMRKRNSIQGAQWALSPLLCLPSSAPYHGSEPTVRFDYHECSCTGWVRDFSLLAMFEEICFSFLGFGRPILLEELI